MSLTQRFHADHILCARKRKLHGFQQEVGHGFHAVTTDGERQKQHVPPVQEEGDGPRNEDQYEEPKYPPENSRAQTSSPRALTAPSSLAVAPTHLAHCNI